jgi:hypothetical protein
MISVKFDIGASIKICREIPNLVEFEQKYWALYIKSYVGFIVAGDIKSPQ